MSRRSLPWIVMGAILCLGRVGYAQPPAGAIRGGVRDRDFDAPLPAAQVLIVETGQKVTTTDQGNYAFDEVRAGKYTLVFSKEGYVRLVKADVVVTAGQLTDVDVSLTGDFTEMEEFVVQDVMRMGAGSEVALLQLRLESPAMLDSIGADLMSRAGASDAASALRLVPGATVEDGKYPVIRGLPDRYVNSQMNSIRLPTADEDKRAVELDQFPASVIESIQVSKTFTPDQQGDASGGAVNLRLKGIPDETIFEFKTQYSYNSQVSGRDDFLTYRGGGVNFLGKDDGGRDIQTENIGRNWDGAVGVTEGDAPIDSKWSWAFGGKYQLDEGVKIGGFASFFYERDSSFYDDGVDDSWWVTTPGGPMVPETIQGTPEDGDFKTALFDVTQGTESVQWGGLGTFGVETENHYVGLTYLYTRSTEDSATLVEDTRGKEYFFPGFDPDDPSTPGHTEYDAAPYIRTETLVYSERSTETLQLAGRHRAPIDDFGLEGLLEFRAPELDWSLSHSSASLYEPDKRQFGSMWFPAREPVPGFVIPATHRPFKPAANFTLGNLQRIWKEIDEESDQYSVNLEFPFRQWSGDEGYLKVGVFDDDLEREFQQETFSNFNDSGASFVGDWGELWSESFPYENHPITASDSDIDYDGKQRISAYYGMLEVPLISSLRMVGGARVERTEMSTVIKPEENAFWYPPGASGPAVLYPGDADVDFTQRDLLPSIGLQWEPLRRVTFRCSYAETVARPIFKELTPVIQQEFSGGPIFIGNPDLRMSALANYDVRLDYAPYPGGLVSASWFHKRIEDPIEYVQRLVTFNFTTPVNYPRGEMTGWEFELRQGLGNLWDPLEGFAVGANATLIDSEVTLPKDEQERLASPDIQAPEKTRDMTGAPEHLYNVFLTYDSALTGTQVGLFWTVQGDTLVAGAGESTGNYVPSLYATEYGTLNFTLSQALGKYLKLTFQAKNLTNPDIETVYRSKYIDDDVTRTSYTKGIDYVVSLSAQFRF